MPHCAACVVGFGGVLGVFALVQCAEKLREWGGGREDGGEQGGERGGQGGGGDSDVC